MRYRNGRLEFIGYLSGQIPKSPAQIFEEQLEKCGVDYFDFYLLHNVCETSFDFYTDEELGVVEYLLEQKKAGRIRHLGFSSHGRPETIDKFLNWKDCFEFVQPDFDSFSLFLTLLISETLDKSTFCFSISHFFIIL